MEQDLQRRSNVYGTMGGPALSGGSAVGLGARVVFECLVTNIQKRFDLWPHHSITLSNFTPLCRIRKHVECARSQEEALE